MTESSGEVLNEKIANLDYLNAIINETLRLHPPVPTLLQRKTPPEGITVEGTYVPGNTIVSCPQYVLGRSESISFMKLVNVSKSREIADYIPFSLAGDAAYDKPDAFIPERWYLYPEMIKDKNAFAPFSTGGSPFYYILNFASCSKETANAPSLRNLSTFVLFPIEDKLAQTRLFFGNPTYRTKVAKHSVLTQVRMAALADLLLF